MEQNYHLGIKALVTNSAGQFLVLKINPAKLRDSDDVYWDIPGGRVQQGATISETLEREVMEETGLRLLAIEENLGTFLSNIVIPTDQGHVGLFLSVYQVRVAESDVVLSEEHTEAQWVDRMELIERLRYKYPAAFLQLISQ